MVKIKWTGAYKFVASTHIFAMSVPSECDDAGRKVQETFGAAPALIVSSLCVCSLSPSAPGLMTLRADKGWFGATQREPHASFSLFIPESNF